MLEQSQEQMAPPGCVAVEPNQHSITLIQLCLDYVHEIMWTVSPSHYRLSHKDQGFTIYEPSSRVYSFDTFPSDLMHWKCHCIL